jgi:hypothetical protein
MLHSAHLAVILYFAIVWMLLMTPVIQDESVSVLAGTSWAMPAIQAGAPHHHA